ncbi:hypothetical protein KSC_001630 [Ktedonobacter sp. SOSP1-52]|uniref:hypothetical protein n=1 Tax=Ktedonobacter sp. SOSP1-52 TaxID=2778366 RepID=UPI001915F838|nr:hypothetical protein [Ktedonobacter sp. SOSP1-52]GHO61271.1 hypothetical protein KSC_001630 [Ktedonobacter sp. SOSP1-52]
MEQSNQKEELLLSHQKEDFQPVIEAIDDWQGIFEIALDTAAQLLPPEQFPATDLQASLAEMCNLLRDVLSQCKLQER